MRTLPKLTIFHATFSNHFNQERSLSSRDTFKTNRDAALAEWCGFCAA
jgi:putative transposase